MAQPSMIAVDLAKRVFQVHGVDDDGVACLTRKLRRSEFLEFFATLAPTVVGLEASPSAHHWGRKLRAQGHEVRLIPPVYVKPFVVRQKNDAADAAAICEAMSRPHMRFVPVKSEQQQASQVTLRAREVLVRQRTMTINAVRGHLAEFGIVAPVGRRRAAELFERLSDPALQLPDAARDALLELVRQIDDCSLRIAALDRIIEARCKADPQATRLLAIPGIGPVTAGAILASAPDPSRFRSGRHFAAWIGLVPKQHSSGGKERLGRISKMGDRTLRRLLINAAMTVIIVERKRKTPSGSWLSRLLARKPVLVAATAFANKLARAIWAMMTRGEAYRPATA